MTFSRHDFLNTVFSGACRSLGHFPAGIGECWDPESNSDATKLTNPAIARAQGVLLQLRYPVENQALGLRIRLVDHAAEQQLLRFKRHAASTP